MLWLMSFTSSDLDHILVLAHLELSDMEKQHFLPQLSSVLSNMKALDRFDLSGLSPSSHAYIQDQSLREDDIVSYPDMNLENNAPSWEDACFSVPKIIEDLS